MKTLLIIFSIFSFNLSFTMSFDPDEDVEMKQDQELHKKLIYYAATGDLAEVKKALEQGANINYIDTCPYFNVEGRNITIKNSKNEIVGSIHIPSYQEGYSALMWAMYNRHLEVAKFLIKAGANVNNQNSTLSYTPLMIAAMKGLLDLARILIENGADVNACSYGNESILFKVADNSIDKHYATNDKNGRLRPVIGMLQLLLENKTDPNIQTHYEDQKKEMGNTALIQTAIQFGDRNHKIIKFLVKNKANINHQNSQGNTALICAAMHSRNYSVRELIKCGANINIVNKQGKNALESITPTRLGDEYWISKAIREASHLRNERLKKEMLRRQYKEAITNEILKNTSLIKSIAELIVNYC